jgi:hypothetical protein
MDTEAQTQLTSEEVPASGKLLSDQERLVFEQLAAGETSHSPWARALLAIDEGASRAEAAQRAGMTSRQVRYWLAKFRKTGVGIFPQQALESATEELLASMPATPEAEEQVEEISKEAEEMDVAEILEAKVEESALEPKAEKSKDKKKKKDKKRKGKDKKKGGKKGKSKKDKSSKKSKKAGKKKSKKGKR